MTLVINMAFILWRFWLPRLVAINVYRICHISQWVSLFLAIGSMKDLTWHHSYWCSMHTTMWVYTSFYTLWKKIESFNEYYLIFYWMLLLLLSEINYTTILLMASLNAIDGKDRWSLYTAMFLSLLLAINNRPTWLAVMAWHHLGDLASWVFGDTCGRQNHWMVLSQCWTASAWLQPMLLIANNCMLSLFCEINNSFNKLINQLQFHLFVVCG